MTTPKSKSKNRPGNYENVSTGTGDCSAGRESENENESESDTPDYENNPENIARVAEEAAKRLQQRRKSPTPALAKSHVIVSTRPPVKDARQAQTLDAKVNTSPGMAKANWSSQEGRKDICGHPLTKTKGYVNTSRSLEDLENRSVPQPPSLPSSFKKEKAAPFPAKPPPKPHLVKVRGYVNQPVR